ncbi:unnamed protein product [Fusarium graminearum]|nr:unnamed protein product [Fusarium graminearum]
MTKPAGHVEVGGRRKPKHLQRRDELQNTVVLSESGRTPDNQCCLPEVSSEFMMQWYAYPPRRTRETEE